MDKPTAYHALLAALANATDAQMTDLRDCLHLGAGLLGLPEGAVLTAPGELPQDRREAYLTLADAIRLQPGDTWAPVHAGAWEDVLATLVLEGDWPRIAATAQDLAGAGR